MNESNLKPEKPKDQPRFNHWQYKFLKLCSKGGPEGIARWNKWRNRHRAKKILLDGADLTKLYLKDVNLGWGTEKNPRRRVYYGIGSFGTVHLKGASFDFSNIEGGRFGLADLSNSNFMDAKLESTCFQKSDLRGAYFLHAIVDSSTLIWECPVTRFCKKGTFTDFTGVSLNSCRIDPKTKQLLEYNIRRQNWEVWYDDENEPIRDGVYIFSNKKISLKTNKILTWLVPLRSVYFSIVTMTTLGLGDMYANAHSLFRGLFGHILLAVQVILGYVLLGALVTRFAVLFTAGGPAGKFADEKEKEDKKK